MSILFQAIAVRHEQRVRLVFTNTLASGAFGAPAPSYYVVSCDDDDAAIPTVQAALIIPGSGNVVELSLDIPIVRGVLYTMSAVGVPATDLSTTPVGSALQFRWGLTSPKVNQEPSWKDKELLLYNIDLLWNGEDYQETATGDLERISGTPNVSKALNRVTLTNPGELIWDNTYGAGAREFVDSPSLAAGTLKGAVSAAILRDPRVKSVKTSYEIADEKTFLYVDPTLISGESPDRVTVAVPNDT